jgi:hypothetical protein
MAAGKPLPLVGAANISGKTATLQVDFNNVDAGLSDFTASLDNDSRTIHQSDTIIFNNVNADDTILIKGDTAGTTTVKISGVNALPQRMDFVEGQHINGIFLILP